MKTILTKAEFAKRMNRSRPCVSGWIAAGKISREALIGDGREAKIWVERAEADLAASLDPSQQTAQSVPILKGLERDVTSRPEKVAPISERERDLARRAKADADKAEHDAEAARRKLALDEGRYVLAEEAAATWGRELAKLIGDTETFISTTLSREISERHGLDWKSLAVDMRNAFRKFRAEASEAARATREALQTAAE